MFVCGSLAEPFPEMSNQPTPVRIIRPRCAGLPHDLLYSNRCHNLDQSFGPPFCRCDRIILEFSVLCRIHFRSLPLQCLSYDLSANSSYIIITTIIIISGLHHYECIVPLVANSLQSGRFWARSTASVHDSPWESRSFCTVFIQVFRGRPGGLI